MKLRPYQEKAVLSVLNEWDKGVQKTLLVLPTGTGKTICFSKVIEERAKQGDRCLILAHRGELLDQAADKLKKTTGLNVAIEKAEDTAIGKWERVTVGSVQSLAQPKRLKKFPKNYYKTIVVDEAHHVVSPTYLRVLEHFEDSKVLGVTATADRTDLKNLGEYFETMAYEYTMPEAIRDGYLSPIKALQIPLELDISGVKQTAGDFQVSGVGHALEPYLDSIADEMLKYCKGRKTVVFMPLISTSEKFVEILKEKGFTATEVNGDSKDRAEILQDFDKGKYEVLCNAMLLTEGWDCPSVDTIIVLRPTKSRSLYTQMVGRGTRLHEGKDHLLLLDFLWLTDEHSLCRPASLITKDDEITQKANEIMTGQEGQAVDLEELVEEADRGVAEEREATLAKTLEANRKKKKKLVDPLEYAVSVLDNDLMNYVPNFGWEAESPTEEQSKELEGLDIDPSALESAGQASLLLDTIKKRKQEGLATPKQIRFLEKRGFKHVGLWQIDEASSMISRISMSNWRIPKGVKPREYKPQSLLAEEWNNHYAR